MERVVLVGIQLPGTSRKDVENLLSELEKLCETAGALPVEKIIQKRNRIDPAYFIGRGKAAELKAILEMTGAKAAIFDEDLKPVQQKNLEELVDAKIIDRTRLILDIFSKRARSKEGILQVELAQLNYMMPRITERFGTFEQQTGGIGTRGPGERKLEVDQRRIRDRIAFLKRNIEHLRKQRETLRQHRDESRIPVITLVGYTNTGKSTLLNLLSHANTVYADNKLFATLDPTTRQVKLPNGRAALFTDTVGFIDKLPHDLVAAFRATLEEIKLSNCLLHVVDVSNPDHIRQSDVVSGVLRELGAENVPLLMVLNKTDLLTEAQKKRLSKNSDIVISARTGQGVSELLERVQEIVTPKLEPHEFVLPYTANGLIKRIFDWSVIKKQKYLAKGIKFKVEAAPEYWRKIKALIKNGY
ncbi:MAG: GTPase HflX [Endomicrobiales bacterium]|nr:GTPase HflX [Endomicrobiales bacterium]